MKCGLPQCNCRSIFLLLSLYTDLDVEVMVYQYIVYSMYKVEISCEGFHYNLRKPIKS